VPKAFSSSGLAVWTRQLAGLVGAGLPLERALTALADEAEEQRQRDLIAHLRSEVNGGATFARALGSVPREFDDVYRAVVAAGEQSGALGRVLERLADDLEERQALKGKLIGAALYPAIVSVIAVFIVGFLVTYVVPQVASVFASGKHALPFLTEMMLAISAFVRQWGLLMVALLAAAAFLFAAALRQPAFRLRFDAAVLNVPLAGASCAATTRPASPARWRCWRAPACPS
jgi:general secretion pathway protein F